MKKLIFVLFITSCLSFVNYAAAEGLTLEEAKGKYNLCCDILGARMTISEALARAETESIMDRYLQAELSDSELLEINKNYSVCSMKLAENLTLQASLIKAGHMSAVGELDSWAKTQTCNP